MSDSAFRIYGFDRFEGSPHISANEPPARKLSSMSMSERSGGSLPVMSVDRRMSDDSIDSLLPPPPPPSSSPPPLPNSPVERFDPCSPHYHDSPGYEYEPMVQRKKPMPHDLSLDAICTTEIKKMVIPMQFEGDAKKRKKLRPRIVKRMQRSLSFKKIMKEAENLV